MKLLLILILGLMTIQESLVLAEKVLVATGFSRESRETEIIDLENPDFVCATMLQQFPEDTWSATGGLIGQKPMICGGRFRFTRFEKRLSQACYTLQEDGSWKEDGATLSKGRMWYGSGSVVLNNELVIARGWDLNSFSKSIEVVGGRKTKARTLDNIELPIETFNSCIVPWNADTFMVIGGNLDVGGGGGGNPRYSLRGTYFVDIKKKTVTNGPDLINARSHHGCSEMIVDGEEFIVVTGGVSGDSRGKPFAVKSTEYLSKANFEDDGWQEGAALPVPVLDHQMVSSSLDKQFVYTIGNDLGAYDKDIFKYTCPSNDIKQCVWTKAKTKLKYGRERLVAFGIPNSLAESICK